MSKSFAPPWEIPRACRRSLRLRWGNIRMWSAGFWPIRSILTRASFARLRSFCKHRVAPRFLPAVLLALASIRGIVLQLRPEGSKRNFVNALSGFATLDINDTVIENLKLVAGSFDKIEQTLNNLGQSRAQRDDSVLQSLCREGRFEITVPEARRRKVPKFNDSIHTADVRELAAAQLSIWEKRRSILLKA
eukprot:g31676.t1